mgnify:CR=1 FL=1
MKQQQSLSLFNKPEFDEIKKYVHKEDLNSIAFFMFEKISSHFKFNADIKNKKRPLFMKEITLGQYNTYRDLNRLKKDSELWTALDSLFKNHIFFMQAAQHSKNS